MDSYRRNRIKKQRVVVNLPPALVRMVDEWGAAVGMQSRRQATEKLLEEGLKTAGGKLGGQAPAVKGENAA